MPDVSRGLLGPAQVLDITQGLLHSPDVLAQLGLLAPRGGYPTTLGLSASHLPKPLSEYVVKRAPNVRLAPQATFTPEQFYQANKGSVMLPVTGDKTVAGQLVTSVEGKPMRVDVPGGGGYMRTPSGGIWANEPTAAAALASQVAKAREKSDTGRVYVTHATMSPTSADFQHSVTNAFLGLLKDAPISRAGAAAVKERMEKGLVETVQGKSVRFSYPDFPGINSPKLKEWLDGGGRRRAHFIQMMDSKKMQEVGVPEVAAARLAVTDLSQLGVPPLSSGMHIAEAFPGLLSSGHPSFSAGIPGRYEGSFGKYLPLQNMFPYWWLEHQSLKNPGRAFQQQGIGRAQPIDQRWLDQIMPTYLGAP